MTSDLTFVKARFKRRTFHVPISVKMSENNRFFSFDSRIRHMKSSIFETGLIRWFNEYRMWISFDQLTSKDSKRTGYSWLFRDL